MNSDPIAEPAAAKTAAPSFKDTRDCCDKIFYVALKLKEPAKRKRFLERAWCKGRPVAERH